MRTPLSINQTLVDAAVRNPAASEDVRRLGESSWSSTPATNG
ncbi:hypothetical protein AB0L25_01570 [Spirillospora sp. NPDC052242]